MLTPGTPITYTLDNLGTLEHPTSARTTSHVVNAGDRGKYLGTLPVFGEPDRWHMTTVEHEGRTLYVPVHEDMFAAERQVVLVGWDGVSHPMLRYRDEMDRPDHLRSIVSSADHDKHCPKCSQAAAAEAEDDPYDMPQEPGWDLTREQAERFAAEVGAELRGEIPPVTP